VIIVSFSTGVFAFNSDDFQYWHTESVTWQVDKNLSKFTVRIPFKLTKFDIHPFVADEIFADFEENEMNKNRLYSGIEWKFVKSWRGKMFYLWQCSKRNGKWIDTHVLGTQIKFFF